MKGRKKSAVRKLTKSEQMARVRSSGTSSELELRKILRGLGVRYSLRRKLPGSPDLVITSSRTAVFVDGCFWHKCPRHYSAPATNVEFWRLKIDRNVARDGRVDRELRRLGWRVMRIWAHELRDAGRVAARIERAIRVGLPPVCPNVVGPPVLERPRRAAPNSIPPKPTTRHNANSGR